MNFVSSYLNVQDCAASPEATFYSRLSTDSGNNINWGFSSLTTDVQSGFMLFLNLTLPVGSVSLPAIPRLGFSSIQDGDFTGYDWAAPTGKTGNVNEGNNTGISFPVIQ